MADQRLMTNLALKIAKFWLLKSIFYVKNHWILNSKSGVDLPETFYCKKVLIFIQLTKGLMRKLLKSSKMESILNKSKKVLTSTTTSSKYIARRPRICINWNPSFQTQIYLIKNSFWKIYEVRSERGDFNWFRFWASWVCTLMLW